MTIFTAYSQFREVWGEPDTTLAADMLAASDIVRFTADSDLDVGDTIWLDPGGADDEMVTVLERVSADRWTTTPAVNNHSTGDAVRAMSKDGYRLWGKTTLYRANGFTTGLDLPVLTEISTLAFPIDITVNASAIGAIAYDFYLSTRSDPWTPFFDMSHKTGYSGTVTLEPTLLSHITYGRYTPAPIDYDNTLRPLLKNTVLYVRRKSDGAIQMGDFTRSVFSTYA